MCVYLNFILLSTLTPRMNILDTVTTLEELIMPSDFKL